MVRLFQNVAPNAGKLQGALPFRRAASLQAPRIGCLARFEIARAVERKLVKDQVWIRLRYAKKTTTIQRQDAATNSAVDDDGSVDAGRVPEEKEEDQEEDEEEEEAVWIVERNANTGDRVAVPSGPDPGTGETVHDDDGHHHTRFYRTISAKRPLPVRRHTDVTSDVLGQLESGVVFASSARKLTDGRVFVQVPLSVCSSLFQDASADAFGWVAQSNLKSNTCYVREIAPPGKSPSKPLFQVRSSLASRASSTQDTLDDGSQGDGVRAQCVAAFAEASSVSRQLFHVRNGTFVPVIGRVYNREHKAMWLQVLTADLDRHMVVPPRFAPTHPTPYL